MDPDVRSTLPTATTTPTLPAAAGSLLDHIHVGLITLDDSGLITSCNRSARRLIGAARQDAAAASPLGHRPNEVLPPVVLDVLYTLQDRLVGEGRAAMRAPVDAATGTVWEVTLVRGDPVGGEGPAVLLVDVSPDVALEDMTLRASAERSSLARRDSGRLKTEFLANVGHEVRTPLNSIIGFAELMASGRAGQPSPRHRAFLADVLTSAYHLLRLINDALDLGQIEAGRIEIHPESLEVEKLVDEVSTVLREQAERRRITLQTVIGPAAEHAHLDALRVKQVLYNYLSNAVKFTHPGDRVLVHVVRKGTRLRIAVEDHGPGINADDQLRLFHEFERLEQGAGRRADGTGLGLALTKRLVEALGGTVGVASRPGHGSVFWCELPDGDPDQANAYPHDPGRPHAPGRGSLPLP